MGFLAPVGPPSDAHACSVSGTQEHRGWVAWQGCVWVRVRFHETLPSLGQALGQCPGPVCPSGLYSRRQRAISRPWKGGRTRVTWACSEASRLTGPSGPERSGSYAGAGLSWSHDACGSCLGHSSQTAGNSSARRTRVPGSRKGHQEVAAGQAVPACSGDLELGLWLHVGVSGECLLSVPGPGLPPPGPRSSG